MHLAGQHSNSGLQTLTPAGSSAELGRQALIGRVEIVPPGLGVVAALTPGEMVGEIFDMDLHSSPVSGEQVEGHAPFLPDHDRLVAVGGEQDLDVTLVVRFVRVLDAHEQPLWWLARFYPPGAFPSTGKEACAVLTAESQVALDLAVPAGQTRGIGECRPHLVDIAVEAVFHPHDALSAG